MASTPSETTCRVLRDLVLLERLPGHQDVARVVLDQEHVDHVENGVGHGAALFGAGVR